MFTVKMGNTLNWQLPVLDVLLLIIALVTIGITVWFSIHSEQVITSLGDVKKLLEIIERNTALIAQNTAPRTALRGTQLRNVETETSYSTDRSSSSASPGNAQQ